MELKTLKKYFDNKCSSEEAKQVLRWLERPDAVVDLEGELKNVWKNIDVKTGDYLKWSGNLEKIHERIEMEELYVSLDLGKKRSKVKPRVKDRPSKTGNELRQYSRKRKNKYFISGLLASVILTVFIISYFQYPSKVGHTPAIEQMEKSTEPGQKLSFHLEDGTKITLNADSKLIYSSNFGDNERKVELEGEAFFEVTKDTARPFRVITESVITTALGTSFNINAFPLKDNIEIALVTGKVSVVRTMQSGKSNSLLLSPGEMTIVWKSDHIIDKSLFNFDQKISWKDGLIYFKDADYHEIVNKLESWYGIEIQTNTIPVKEWKFSGQFEDETLENILIALQFGHEFEYEIKGKIVKLNF